MTTNTIEELRAEIQELRDGYCAEAYILMRQALDVKALSKERRRILSAQCVRMANVGLGTGKPRSVINPVGSAQVVLRDLNRSEGGDDGS